MFLKCLTFGVLGFAKPRRKNPEFLFCLLYRGTEGILFVFFLLLALSRTPYWLDRSLVHIRGEWVDKAVSEVFTQNYGNPVSVRGVRFESWKRIRFESLDVISSEGRKLVTSLRGSLELQKYSLIEPVFFETELQLSRVVFWRDYYKDSPRLKGWGFLVRKPLRADRLTLRIFQNKVRTSIGLSRFQSPDVTAEGRLIVDNTGGIRDEIRVTMSPWKMLRSAI